MYLRFRLIKALVQKLPPRAAYAVGAVVAEIYYLFASRNRKNFKANLKHVLEYRAEDIRSSAARRRIRRIVRKNFRNFAYYLIDFFRFSALEEKEMENLVEVEGEENIALGLREGKGLVGVTAHLGNWELAGVVFAGLGFPINAVALSHGNTKLNRLFTQQRALGGMKVIPVGSAARASLRALRNNEVLVILGDRDVTERGVVMGFFGAPAQIPRGPSALAARTGAGVLIGYMVREGTHRYRLTFTPPIEVDRSRPEAEVERSIREAMVRRLEEVIGDHLDQWYVYYRIWPDEYKS
ncbi:MAG TPA: lysophospholipid acyltransferase family protein [bacterium]|nr:lysophospholipid acyltransferase family protein [bacterium]HPQ66899.1 lysophospholipid acyltransferase family protein [bacterium]